MISTAQLQNDQMIFSVQDLKDKGFSYYKIKQMVDMGNLIKLNKKYYENANFDGEESDFYYAYTFVPGGVAYLLSAAVCIHLIVSHECTLQLKSEFTINHFFFIMQRFLKNEIP